MAKQLQLDRVYRGVEAWNRWRQESNEELDLEGVWMPGIDFSGYDFSNGKLDSATFHRGRLRGANFRDAHMLNAHFPGSDLSGADFSGAFLNHCELNFANFTGAVLAKTNLSGAKLMRADLTRADLTDAGLYRADLTEAKLVDADLSRAHLNQALLYRTDFTRARLVDADLSYASLIGTIMDSTDLTGCRVFGISAWDVVLKDVAQFNLVITPANDAPVTVDNLEVAQFIYLLLRNEKIRGVIDTVTSKLVLILGRFTPERKAILDALRGELRKHNYLPVVFDFEQPSGRNLTETVSTLAHMARFVVADITDAKSIPQELQRIVPDLPSLPVQPIILDSQYEYAMFKDFLDYPSVLLPHRYAGVDELLACVEETVIAPAIAKANEIAARRRDIERLLLGDGGKKPAVAAS